jgi:hypothetical protein
MHGDADVGCEACEGWKSGRASNSLFLVSIFPYRIHRKASIFEDDKNFCKHLLTLFFDFNFCFWGMDAVHSVSQNPAKLL